jgi:small subunit ribosomal protein S13
MVYILNTEISDNKPISSAIQSIFGVGKTRSLILCQEFGIKPDTKLKKINKNIQNKIVNYIQKEYVIGNELKKFLIETNNEYVHIRSYKGNRIKNKLPRRGQRTHTNSKTAKKTNL